MKRPVKLILGFMALTAAVGLLLMVYRAVLKKIYPTEYTEFVEQAAEEFSLDPLLVYAVINCESGFDKDAVSGADAMGLMQITEDTFNWAKSKLLENELPAAALFDPATNIRYGCFILSMHLEEFGSTELALAAYHAGRGIVNAWLADEKLGDGKTLRNIPYKDTSLYIKKVSDTLSVYENLY